jgi:hypothetical protein
VLRATNIRDYCTTLSRHGDLSPDVCAPLLIGNRYLKYLHILCPFIFNIILSSSSFGGTCSYSFACSLDPVPLILVYVQCLSVLTYCPALKMEAAYSFETLAPVYRSFQKTVSVIVTAMTASNVTNFVVLPNVKEIIRWPYQILTLL